MGPAIAGGEGMRAGAATRAWAAAFRHPLAARVAPVAVAALGATACAPALDWREVRPPGASVVVMLPCKPSSSVRTVPLAGQSVRLAMLACKAQDRTWAIVATEVAEPALVGAALVALRESTRANLRGREVAAAPAAVPGATPHAAQARVQVHGQRQDGVPADAEFVVFSHGTQVFQAIVLGAGADARSGAGASAADGVRGGAPTSADAAIQTFFESLRAAPLLR